MQVVEKYFICIKYIVRAYFLDINIKCGSVEQAYVTFNGPLTRRIQYQTYALSKQIPVVENCGSGILFLTLITVMAGHEGNRIIFSAFIFLDIKIGSGPSTGLM